uniref:Uncharacterized protein n=1 Tax=Strombidium inclinatum TaxID=197538 RepID=A0A7S3MWP1_9SPIT
MDIGNGLKDEIAVLRRVSWVLELSWPGDIGTRSDSAFHVLVESALDLDLRLFALESFARELLLVRTSLALSLLAENYFLLVLVFRWLMEHTVLVGVVVFLSIVSRILLAHEQVLVGVRLRHLQVGHHGNLYNFDVFLGFHGSGFGSKSLVETAARLAFIASHGRRVQIVRFRVISILSLPKHVVSV